MTIIPSGLPAWTRTASFETYGGHTEKENYLGEGAINAKTDVAAEEFSRMVADAAAMARTAPFMVAMFSCDDSTPGAPLVEYVAMMTGIQTTWYTGDAPPTGFPLFERVSDGIITITFASTYTDEYGVVGDFTPRIAQASARGSGTPFRTARASASGQVVQIAIVDGAGTPIANAPASIVVY